MTFNILKRPQFMRHVDGRYLLAKDVEAYLDKLFEELKKTKLAKKRNDKATRPKLET